MLPFDWKSYTLSVGQGHAPYHAVTRKLHELGTCLQLHLDRKSYKALFQMMTNDLEENWSRSFTINCVNLEIT